MYGMPLGRQMELWWQAHGGNEESPDWHRFIDIFTEYLKLKNEEHKTKHENINKEGEKVIGMSKSIGCTKAELLKFYGAKGKEKSGSERFTFFLGHSVEIAVLATLKAMNFDIEVQKNVYSPSSKRASAADGKCTYLGKPTLISVKSTGYKMSGGKRNKLGKYDFVRRGFAALPMEGVRKSEHGHLVQLNQEMLAEDIEQSIIIYASKDMIKVYENDEWLAKRNGSLTFYTEYIRLDRDLSLDIEKHWDDEIKYAEETRRLDRAFYFNKFFNWVKLEQGDYDPQNIWGGPNQKATGTFNPCGGCDFVHVCKDIRSISDI